MEVYSGARCNPQFDSAMDALPFARADPIANSGTLGGEQMRIPYYYLKGGVQSLNSCCFIPLAFHSMLSGRNIV